MSWVKNITKKSLFESVVSRETIHVPARRLLVLEGEEALAAFLDSEEWRRLEQPRRRWLSWLGNADRYDLILIGAAGAAEYRCLWPDRVRLAGKHLIEGTPIQEIIAQLHEESETAPAFIAVTKEEPIVSPAVVVEHDQIVQAVFDKSLRRGRSDRPHRSEPPLTEGRGTSRGGGGCLGYVTDSLRRTPHMDISTPEPIAPGTRFTVEIHADKSAARAGEITDDIVIDAARDENEFHIHVSIIVSQGLTIVGPTHDEIIIRRHEDRSTSAKFLLVVNASAPLEEPAKILAFFAHNFRPSGSVMRHVKFAMSAGTTLLHEDDDPPVRRLELVRAQPPDLFVDIRPARVGADRNFECCVLSPYLPEFRDPSATTPWEFTESTDKVVASKLAAFVQQKSAPALAAALRGAGLGFFEKAPENFRKAFWQLIDSGTPLRTILIVTAERYIPWELMVPQRNDSSEPRAPLGVEFAIGRWITEKHDPPPRVVQITDSFLIYPNYSDPERILQHAGNEAKFVEDNFNGHRIDPAIFATLEARFKEGGASLLHFICHGSSTEAEQYLDLENDEKLNVDQVRGMKGIRAACQNKRSFVFLNACEVGRKEPALTGSDGFAPCFIRMGASAVIAPLWSIEDKIAPEIAMDFYGEALKYPRRAFADIMRSIRERAYGDDGRDTYAAYAFYGDPAATLAEW